MSLPQTKYCQAIILALALLWLPGCQRRDSAIHDAEARLTGPTLPGLAHPIKDLKELSRGASTPPYLYRIGARPAGWFESWYNQHFKSVTAVKYTGTLDGKKMEVDMMLLSGLGSHQMLSCEITNPKWTPSAEQLTSATRAVGTMAVFTHPSVQVSFQGSLQEVYFRDNFTTSYCNSMMLFEAVDDAGTTHQVLVRLPTLNMREPFHAFEARAVFSVLKARRGFSPPPAPLAVPGKAGP